MTKKELENLKKQSDALFEIALKSDQQTFHKIAKIVGKLDALIDEAEERKARRK